MVNGLIHLVPISDAQVWITINKNISPWRRKAQTAGAQMEQFLSRCNNIQNLGSKPWPCLPICARTEYYDFGRAPRPDGSITLCSCTAKKNCKKPRGSFFPAWRSCALGFSLSIGTESRYQCRLFIIFPSFVLLSLSSPFLCYIRRLG